MKKNIYYAILLVSTIALSSYSSQPQPSAPAANSGAASAQQPDMAAKVNAATNAQNQEDILTPEEEALINELSKFPKYNKEELIDAKKKHQAAGKGDQFIEKMRIVLESRKKIQEACDQACASVRLANSVNHSEPAATAPQRAMAPAPSAAPAHLIAASNAVQPETHTQAISNSRLATEQADLELDRMFRESLKEDEEACDKAIAAITDGQATSRSQQAQSSTAHKHAISKPLPLQNASITGAQASPAAALRLSAAAPLHLTAAAHGATAASTSSKEKEEITLTADEEELIRLIPQLDQSQTVQSFKKKLVEHKKKALEQGKLEEFNRDMQVRITSARDAIAANVRLEELQQQWLRERQRDRTAVEATEVASITDGQAPFLAQQSQSSATGERASHDANGVRYPVHGAPLHAAQERYRAQQAELNQQQTTERANFKKRELNAWLGLSTTLSSVGSKCVIG